MDSSKTDDSFHHVNLRLPPWALTRPGWWWLILPYFLGEVALGGYPEILMTLKDLEYSSGWFLLTSMSLKRFVGVPKFWHAHIVDISTFLILKSYRLLFIPKDLKIHQNQISPKAWQILQPRIYYSKNHWTSSTRIRKLKHKKKHRGIKTLGPRIWGTKKLRTSYNVDPVTNYKYWVMGLLSMAINRNG